MNLRLSELADVLVLGDLLDVLVERHGGYELVDHWPEGEYHHDLVLHVKNAPCELVVSTNCNGGVKEVLGFTAGTRVTREALWAYRCKDAKLEGLVEASRTVHYQEPCEILEGGATAA